MVYRVLGYGTGPAGPPGCRQADAFSLQLRDIDGRMSERRADEWVRLLVFRKDLILDQLAEDMAQGCVTFLDARGHAGRYDEGVIHHGGQLASVATGPSNRLQAGFAGCGDPFQHVGRIAAGADADGDIAFPTVCEDLAGEHLFVSIVIGDTRDSGHVRSERESGERRAVPMVTTDEFGGDVGRVGRAAAVAEQ